MPVTAHDVLLLSPFLAILGAAGLAVAADLFIGRLERAALPFLSVAGLAAAAMALVNLWGRNEEAFAGAIRTDDFSIVLGLTAVGATAISVLMSATYVRPAAVDFGEFYALMLTACAGAVLLAQANDLMMVFLGIEILSISIYCLTGITRDREKSAEAAMKYFIMGAFSTGFLLFGFAFLYGAAASQPASPGALSSACLRLDSFASIPADNPLLLAGLALFLIGFSFKLGAVPFHAWTPDAYEGAPAPVTGFMAAVVKAGAVGALLRAATVAFPHLAYEWGTLLALLAAATMIVGNLFALAQTNLKRLLAYSSIGHTGYILVGVATAALASDGAGHLQPESLSAVVFYVAAYAVTTVGSFGIVSLLSRPGAELEDVSHFAGLASKRPAAAAAMTLFMASLAGIPPTAGFIGKFLIFKEAVSSPETLWLALIGIATSMLSAYYYLKIVVSMYMRAPEKGEEFGLTNERWGAGFALALSAAGTVLLGVVPMRLIEWCAASIRELA